MDALCWVGVLVLFIWLWTATPFFCWFGLHQWEPYVTSANAFRVLAVGRAPRRCRRCGLIEEPATRGPRHGS